MWAAGLTGAALGAPVGGGLSSVVPLGRGLIGWVGPLPAPSRGAPMVRQRSHWSVPLRQTLQ
ncbi:hypothetical protein D3C72_2232980 [compost metagenome]